MLLSELLLKLLGQLLDVLFFLLLQAQYSLKLLLFAFKFHLMAFLALLINFFSFLYRDSLSTHLREFVLQALLKDSHFIALGLNLLIFDFQLHLHLNQSVIQSRSLVFDVVYQRVLGILKL